MTTYINDLQEVIDNVPAKDTSNRSFEWKEIQFKNVEFKYPNSSTIISIPSFKIFKNDIALITGESGQGKTTVLHLIANLYEPISGVRNIGEFEYGEIDQNYYRDNVVIVSQEVELFNISLRENLALGNSSLTDEKLIAALHEVGLTEWIKELPDGLSTKVGERGLKLSAGQRQRINLVRGLLLNRSIILLDEPTSHLDTETESKVLEFLKRNLVGKTAVIVSHKETLNELANKRFCVKGHKLIQQN